MEEVETFEPCSDEHVKEILALDASAHSDWSAISAVTDEEGNTIEVFRQRMDTGLDKLKALVTTVHITADVVHEVLYNIETRVNWDHGGKDMQVVEKIDDELDVIYFWAKAPPTFTNREFLQSRLTRTLDDGTRVIIYRSVKHDKFPEKPKKFVRAYTKLSGYVIKPNPSGEGCRVTFLSQNDIKASIPSWVVNLLASFFMKKWLNTLRDACNNQLKENAKAKE